MPANDADQFHLDSNRRARDFLALTNDMRAGSAEADTIFLLTLSDTTDPWVRTFSSKNDRPRGQGGFGLAKLTMLLLSGHPR